MKITVIPVGSAGDVHPYISVARALQQRGHDVRVITNPYFEALTRKVGLAYVPVGTTREFHNLLNQPDLWNHIRGLRVIGQAVAYQTAELYELIEREERNGCELLIAPGLAFAARIAHEVMHLPLVTMHLQPSCLMSIHDFAVPHVWLSSINDWPIPIKRLVRGFGDYVADRALSPGPNAFRSKLGLLPIRHVVSDWWHSPQRVIGLFPEWYAGVQPDWPKQTVQTGFPLYDEGDVTPVEPDLEAYLTKTDRDRPIVFMAGSGNRQASNFFLAAIDACARLGRQGILLTRFPEQLPTSLPKGIRHFHYAPLSNVLPYAAALVHHGGIGTTAQALFAGCPQLVMPMTFDQPDNAARIQRLGVGRSLPPSSFTGTRVARELEHLTESDSVARHAQATQRLFDDTNPIARTCELIETTV
jgi:UDP:flavonoid glycosyltransferase YjiC (YdhE family)